MERSESIKELSKALVEFHKKVGKVIKDAKGNIPTKSGSSYSYRYATLSNILDVIQEPLNECGLTVIQLPTAEFELETMLTHVSGEYIVSRYLMRPTQNNPQGIGSCITYQRRYAIGAILGLNIDEDDDAAAACGYTSAQTKPQPQPKKTLTLEALNDKFMAWVYKRESETRAKGSPFSLKGLLDNNYRVDAEIFNKASEIYVNYKTNNNLK